MAPPVVPTNFADWAISPPAQSSLNEQQTISFVGVPVSGGFIINIGNLTTAVINWNDSNVTIASKINAIYNAAQATIASGSIATGSLVIDWGVTSQQYIVQPITITNNTMVTSGNAGVFTYVTVNQSSQLPAVVTVDGGHATNGFQLFEKAPFNIFNGWMNTVGLWIRYFWANAVSGIPQYNAAITYNQYSFVVSAGLLYFSLQNTNTANTPVSSPTFWQLFSGQSAKGPNMFRNASFLTQSRGTGGTITAGSSAYTLDGWIVGCSNANVAWNTNYGGATGAGFGIELNGAANSTDSFIKQRIDNVITNSIPQSTYVTAQISLICFSTFTPTITVNRANSPNNFSSVATEIAKTNLQQCVPGFNTVAYTFQLSGSATSNGIEVVFDFGSELNTNRIYLSLPDCSVTPSLTNVGIQPNPPTAEIRLPPQEIQFNNSYLRTMVNGDVYMGCAIGSTSSNVFLQGLPMRSTPTVSYSALSDFQIKTFDGSTTITPSSITVAGSANTPVLVVGVASGFTTQVPMTFAAINTGSELYLSAEL